jgi:hypothetical protein
VGSLTIKPIFSGGKSRLLSNEEEARWGQTVGLDALEKSFTPASKCNSINNDYALYSELNVALLNGRRGSKRAENK